MFDLPTLLPPNSQKIEYDLEQLSARQRGMADPIQNLWDAEICLDRFLPFLAWAFSVEVWDAAWPAARKRAVISRSIAVHRQKGTLGSVRRALEAIGFKADIREWFEVDGVELARAPGTFEVTTIFHEDADLGGDGLARSVDVAKRVIDATKPVSAHYSFRIGQKITGASRLGASGFGCMVDTRTPRVEANAQATRRPSAAFIGHIRNTASTLPVHLARRSAVAIFGKLEAV